MAETYDTVRALPVLLTVGHAREGGVLRYVDGVLGWQVVSQDMTGPLRARVQLTDDLSRIVSGIPAILLVDDGGVSASLAKQLARHAGVAVCAWPSERDQLTQIAAHVLTQGVHESGVSTLTIGGGAGGVGTTTLALCLGGLFAWHGASTLVVINDVSSRVRSIPHAALTDPALWDQATNVAGVAQCRSVRVSDDVAQSQLRDVRIACCVYDVGVSYDVDVLVVRPDRAGLHAIGQTTASVVIAVGDGVLSPAKLRQACGSRRLVHVDHSVRVARAVAAERVPAGVPGRWLQPVRGLIGAGVLPASG